MVNTICIFKVLHVYVGDIERGNKWREKEWNEKYVVLNSSTTLIALIVMQPNISNRGAAADEVSKQHAF